MPRRPRIHLAGGIYHVILRGNHRQQIFYCDSDRDLIETTIARAIRANDTHIHAYCWMSNHIHLAVQVGTRPLGHFMQSIASQYARRVQRNLLTTGHLFERRYKAILINDTAYLVSLVRYIHRNPVRAGLVAEPTDYPWSSHRAYVGLTAVSWLTTESILALFGSRLGDARRAYRKFLSVDGPDSELTLLRGENSSDPRLLGTDSQGSFSLGENASGPPSETLSAMAEHYAVELGVSLSLLRSQSRSRKLCRIRAQIAARLLDERSAQLSEVARLFGRSPSTLHGLLERHFAQNVA
ncbi:MAG: transposase [Gammaproteobacteria bacterium]|nr:transposase [Gammaproteobacteria bacterium]